MAITDKIEPFLRRLRKENRVVLLAGCVSIIAVFSLFFHPRVQANIFPSVRVSELTKLVESTRASRTVDPLLFWQIRDEYGSGFFTLSSDHTIFRETQELVIQPRSEQIEFSTYHGERVESHDYFTPWNTLPHDRYSEFLDQFTEANLPPERSIFRDEDTRIYLTKDDELVVSFVKPISELAKVDGLYNLSGSILETLQGREWVDITVFKLDCCTKSLQALTEAAQPH